jgi:hypothetical protein
MGQRSNPSPTYPAFPGSAAAVVPSDSVNLAQPATIYIGGAGNASVLTEFGDTVTFTALPVGSVIPVRVARVNATNTTATLMIAIY